MRRLSLIWVVMLLALGARAQVMDSISASFKKKPTLTGGFSTRQTFIDGFKAPVWSARIGVDFNNRVRLGGGISFLKEPYLVELPVRNTVTGLNDTVSADMHLQYFHYHFEYVYFKTKKWEFSVPVELGFGRSFNDLRYGGTAQRDDSRFVFIYQPVVTGYYRFTFWFGLGADVGYRFLLTNDKATRQQFSAPVYAINTIIFWGALYKKVFPGSKLGQRI